jgi:hypothetical protein
VTGTVVAPTDQIVVFRGRKEMPWSPQSSASRHNKKLSGVGKNSMGWCAK